MDEREWLSSTDPQAMLAFLRDAGTFSERKGRLFGVACCLCFPFGKDERFRQAVEVTERYADGRATKASLKRARQAVRAARYELPADDVGVRGEWGLYWLAEVAASENAYAAVGDEVSRLATEGILSLPGGGCLRSALSFAASSVPFHSALPLSTRLSPAGATELWSGWRRRSTRTGPSTCCLSSPTPCWTRGAMTRS